MDFNYSQPNQVQISMISSINEMLNVFPDQINGTTATSTANYLFEVRTWKDAAKLSDELVIAFHHNVPKLLFLRNQRKKSW